MKQYEIRALMRFKFGTLLRKNQRKELSEENVQPVHSTCECIPRDSGLLPHHIRYVGVGGLDRVQRLGGGINDGQLADALISASAHERLNPLAESTNSSSDVMVKHCIGRTLSLLRTTFPGNRDLVICRCYKGQRPVFGDEEV